ncbi:MAG: delta-lactam-biosynthetic de-N-acetylase [Lachnospiraceae bacterium]
MKKKLWKAVGILTLFGALYLAGATAAEIVNVHSEAVVLQSENWGLGFGEEGTVPTGTVSAEQLKSYNAYYVGDSAEKKLYLTFDAGYENGNTEKILEALKKHQVSATFFVVGNYLETQPELVKRMIAEGHTVGNHTYHHPDMSSISEMNAFSKEIKDLEALYREITGEEISKYYRPPQGKYSEKNLEMAKELGYTTFFWSLAYVDWLENDQPTKEEAFEKLLKRVHPGAIVLLHSTSSTNGNILDELLTEWEKMGYTFGTLEELCLLQ